MSDPLPLAAAAQRLRGRPGRPRRGTVGAQGDAATRVNGGPARASQDVTTDGAISSTKRRPAPLTERRLLDVQSAADYLGGLGTDTVREMALGALASARVYLPGAAGPLRKVLFDRLELDRLVAGWRAPA